MVFFRWRDYIRFGAILVTVIMAFLIQLDIGSINLLVLLMQSIVTSKTRSYQSKIKDIRE